MPQVQTPGVFIAETDGHPDSVVSVNTAVPAFIGHTEKAVNGPNALRNIPFRLSSMAQFERQFGGAPTPMFDIRDTAPPPNPAALGDPGAGLPPIVPAVSLPAASGYALVQTNPAYCLYAAMRHFFFNGGEDCYVVSVGDYTEPFDADTMVAAIKLLENQPEPTLLVIPETTRLPRAPAQAVQQSMLAHCGVTMRNRMAILDILSGHLPQDSTLGDPVAGFRQDIGTTGLGFGAAYYPWLNTSIFSANDFGFGNINPASHARLQHILADDAGSDSQLLADIAMIGAPGLSGDFTLNVATGGQVVLTPADISASDDSSIAEELRFEILDAGQMPGHLVTTGTDTALTQFTQAELAQGQVSFIHDATAAATGQFDVIATDKDGLATLSRTFFVLAGSAPAPPATLQATLHEQATEATNRHHMLDRALRASSPVYAQITQAIATAMNTLPPGAAMAGLYTMVDASRGVWNAPANLSVRAVTSPTVQVTSAEQELLNVSPTGKSVNAIRSFTGRGTLVWGARTLAGNDNEYRYVSVRRTAIMIEKSIRLALEAFVFDPNVTSTWAAIRVMTENFLTSLWMQGGLMGATPDQAFSVRIGLGDTMTAADIQAGRLRLSVLIALTRPAEFIVLNIQQNQMQSH